MTDIFFRSGKVSRFAATGKFSVSFEREIYSDKNPNGRNPLWKFALMNVVFARLILLRGIRVSGEFGAF